MSEIEPTKGRFEVDKFDGEGDFALWKHKMLAQLEILGFLSVLQTPPREVTDEEGVEGTEEVTKQDSKWLEKDRRVRSLLSHSLADIVLRKVMKEPTAYDMWRALENTYQVMTLPNRFYLKQRFFSFKMEEDKNLDKNLDTFNKLISDLSSLNVVMSEEDTAAILMNSLPKRFDHLVHTLKYSGGKNKDVITPKEIIMSAYSMELELKDKGVLKKPADEGLFVQTRGRTEKRGQSKGKTNSRSKSKVKKRACWICGSEEHLKRECPKKNQASTSQKGEASIAQAQRVEPLMLAASERHTDDAWILDSGCSYHMTCRRDLMFDVEKVNGGKILMGNDTFCEISAIGKVKIVNSNGTEVILSQVRYSSTARRNLISLGQLETNGCWYQSKDYRMRIYKDDREVLAGDYRDTLYFLDGKAELEQVNAAETEMDTTTLWHSRLCHTSEKVLKLLVKKDLLKGSEISELKQCEDCILGKSHRLSFKTGKHTSQEILEYVHSDLWGSPNVTPSLAKCQYYISFVDDFSRKA